MSLWRTPRTRAILAVGILAGVAAVVSLAIHTYTEVLWFRELGQERVFWTTLKWKLLPPAFVLLGTTCALLANFALVERRTRAVPAPERRAAALLWRFRGLVFPLVAIAGGIVSVLLRPAGMSRLVLLWANRGDFGVADPLFHRDVGFFVFSLPLYELVAAWLLETLVIAGAMAIAAYAMVGRLHAARAHLLSLAALVLAVIAWRYRLEELRLALPHAGKAGASYTDVHVRLPALRVLVFVSLAGAAGCLVSTARRVSLVPMVALGIVGLVATAAGSALPELIERFDVAPQKLARERPYVADSIASTRRAFALDRIDVRPLDGSGALSAREVAENLSTIENVPLWDSRVLRPAINELQSIGGYYGFPSATVDRYAVHGKSQLITVAARQLDLTHLRADARTWTNERFAYTHGYGVVATRAGQTDADGYPRFAQRDFGPSPLGLTQPRIYYGEHSESEPPYLVLNSTRGEVEEPAPGSGAPGYHYDGPGGIALSNLFTRAAFALRFGDLKLLLTQNASSRSRIVVHRDVRGRLQALAPFLKWDRHPQTVVAGGRVQFLFHGYTTSDHYPYSASVRAGVNYLRGSAVAAVDAFSGHVSLYADQGDPILRAWQAAYPTLLLPLSRMAPELRAHLRYPQRLFAAQAQVYATYHASDATGFWNGADAWERSRQLAGPVESAGDIHFPEPDERSATRAGYLLARLPGDPEERFVLATTFTPRGRQNLVAYLAGSVDARGVQQLTLLSLPRNRSTMGPTQATRAVLASPAVTSRLQILNRESRDLGKDSVTRTILGVPRVIPLGDALVHVQPVYVTAGGTGLPRLQLVTAYANGRVGYGRDVRAAVRSLLDRAGRAGRRAASAAAAVPP